MGKLTTHVLDLSLGKPAANVAVVLYRRSPQPGVIISTRTNQDGRCDQPLAQGDALIAGEYELSFQVAEYFRATNTSLPEIPFLNEVVLRVGIGDTSQHYHVPLLVSPWSYSTYRGS